MILISRHACERYAKRIAKYKFELLEDDYTDIRNEIAAHVPERTVRAMDQMGEGKFVIGNKFVMVLKNKIVVTIIKSIKKKQNHAAKHRCREEYLKKKYGE